MDFDYFRLAIVQHLDNAHSYENLSSLLRKLGRFRLYSYNGYHYTLAFFINSLDKKILEKGLTNPSKCVIIPTESEVIEMAKKKVDRRAFKKTGEELQQWLIFRKRGSKVESGKKYNRQKFKKGEI